MRMKGVLALADHPERCVVQGVYELFDKTMTTEWGVDEARLNRLVFIGEIFFFLLIPLNICLFMLFLLLYYACRAFSGPRPHH